MTKFLNVIRNEILSWIESFVVFMPGRLGGLSRRLWFGARGASFGARFSSEQGCRLVVPQGMTIGSDVSLGENCRFSAGDGQLHVGSGTKFNSGVSIVADFGSIRLGSNVLVAMNVVMRSTNHKFDRTPKVPIALQGHEPGSIEVGDDVWIGANVILLPGTKIGSHSVIGAGAVVKGEIPSCSVAVGIPAKVVKSLGRERSDAAPQT